MDVKMKETTRKCFFVICLIFFVASSLCTGDRVVMKADIVRDYPDKCYDVSSCRPRRLNESWSLGPCVMAICEKHEAEDMLLEVHYTCPRFQVRGLTAHCELIEDLRLPFPWCCPRVVCRTPPTTTTSTTTTESFGNSTAENEDYNDIGVVDISNIGNSLTV